MESSSEQEIQAPPRKKERTFYDEDKKHAPRNIKKTWVWLERYEKGETDKYYKIVQEEEKPLMRAQLERIRDDIPDELEKYKKMRNKGILQLTGAGVLGACGAGVMVYVGHESVWALFNYMGMFLTQTMLNDHLIDQTLEGYNQVIARHQPEQSKDFQQILPLLKTDITQYTKDINSRCTANARWHGTTALLSTALSIHLFAFGSWTIAAGIKNIYTSLDQTQKLNNSLQAANKALKSPVLSLRTSTRTD